MVSVRLFWLWVVCLSVVSCTQEASTPVAPEPTQPELRFNLADTVFTTPLVARHSAKCADVPRSSRNPGTDLIQWTCHNEANQQFSFHPTGGGYAVKNKASGLCLEVSLEPRDRLYYVSQETCVESANQQFTLRPSGADKVFSLVANHNGACVDIVRASKDNRAKLIGYRCHGGANQAWTLTGYKAEPAPEPRQRVKVIAAGDISCSPGDSAYNGGNGTDSRCRMKATAKRAELLNPDAVLVLGDLQYSNGLYEDFLASYADNWGRFKTKTYPAPGNHEYDSQGAAGYYKYFGSRAGNPAKGYYSFNLGDWHIVVLNTNSSCSTVSCASGSAQEKWLRADLAANSKRCVLATMHHPRYSSGRHGNTGSVAALWRALAEGGADAVLAGHDHHYERFAPQNASGNRVSAGLRQFVVGTGGKSLYATKGTRPNSQRIIEGRYGVLELSLGADDYEWAFVTESGARLDAGGSSCY